MTYPMLGNPNGMLGASDPTSNQPIQPMAQPSTQPPMTTYQYPILGNPNGMFSAPAPQTQAPQTQAPQMQAPPMQAPVPQPMPMMSMDPSQLQQMSQPNTVLSQPAVQDKAARMTDLLMNDWINGHNRERQDQFLPTKLFSGAAGVLGGLLGGGYAQGGNQVLQQANQQLAQAKAERHNQTKDALEGMRYLNNFVNSTSPGSLAATGSWIKSLQNKDNNGIKLKEIDLKQKDLDRKTEFGKQRLADAKQVEADKVAQNAINNRFKATGQQDLRDHYDQSARLQSAAQQIQLTIADAQNKLQQNQGDQKLAATIATLLQRKQIIDAGAQQSTQETIAKLMAQKAQRDANGAFKNDPKLIDDAIQHLTGAPQPNSTLDLSSLMSPQDQSDHEKAFADAMALSKAAAQPPQQPQGQLAQQPNSFQQTVANLDRIKQRYGFSNEQARAWAKQHGVSL